MMLYSRHRYGCRLRGLLVFLLLLPALLLAATPPVAAAQATPEAQVFLVNKTADTYDGVCNEADCSLRDALRLANFTGGGPHTVIIPAGIYIMTRAGTGENNSETGDYDLWNSPMMVIGAGATNTIIDGSMLDQVFEINAQVITMTGMTIRNGRSGMHVFNKGRLDLSDSVIAQNTANYGGGGIRVDGPGNQLTLNNVTISSNQVVSATNDGAGIFLDTNSSLTMNGGVISGNGSSGVRDGAGIYSLGLLVLNSVTVAGNGSLTNGARGGGIYSGGTASLANLIVSNNTTYVDAAGGSGGGIYNAGEMTVISSTISNNQAGAWGGGISHNGGNLAVSYTTISGNSAIQSGGGMYANGTVQVDNCTISANQVNGNYDGGGGGGLLLLGPAFAIRSSLILSNTALLQGAGAHLNGTSTSGTFANVTFSGNQLLDPSQEGAALHVYDSITADSSLVNVTFQNNLAGSGRAASIHKSLASTGKLYLKNIIFGDNPGGAVNCSGGALNSQGGNVNTGLDCSLGAPGDQVSQTISLGPLANNGGSTLTFMPLSANLINQGTNIGCPFYDQRGVPRPQGLQCEVGAVEVEEPNASLSGVVYVDANNNGLQDPGEPGIPSVPLTLSGAAVNGSAINLTATTDASGAYTFTNVLVGTYLLSETKLADFPDGIISVGIFGGTVGIRQVSNINVAWIAAGTGYNFGHGKGSQTIYFEPIMDHKRGDAPFPVYAYASSALAVSFASLTPQTCAVDKNNVVLLDTGQCVIRASQEGSPMYNAASPEDQSFMIKPGDLYLPVVKRGR